MRIYEVYVKSDPQGIVSDVRFLKQGFSIYGFIFSVFWLLYHRIWLAAWIFIPTMIFLNGIETRGFISAEHNFILALGIQLLIGFSGNDWLGKALESRGYHFAGVCTGSSQITAEQRFFDHFTVKQA